MALAVPFNSTSVVAMKVAWEFCACGACFWQIDTHEELTGGISAGFSLCISLPDMSESGWICTWSLPSTSFVDVSGSREQQHGFGAESTAASESGFGGQDISSRAA